MHHYEPKLKAIFDHVVELASDAERIAYLDEVCIDKPELRREVDRLMQAFQRAGSFLESPPTGLTATCDSGISECPGAEVGPYKLLQQIGEGGFGVVFMAEQQKPIRRKVALKIIKPGMDTKDVIARFEAERQALALMDHPNIARVLDAGTTTNGRPFFVMELVRGVPITEFCDTNNLSTRERLELFVAVCRAVQHAHMKGIIHRDIKPTNVMVTLHDNRPLPKIIDFGVSKAISQQLTEKTLFTAYGQMVGTPQYMSPEQAQMSALDIDTRSDIYSLGVLLYELLTSITPLSPERLRGSAYGQVQRMIQEEEPQKPSVRLSTLGDALETVAKHHGTEPKRLGQFVRGDLDWIVMKALEKDRSDRYDTAVSFAADVERFLRDEATEARPPSSLTRVRRVVRRNQGPVIAASLILISLVTGLLFSLFAWWDAENSRRILSDTATELTEQKGKYQATLQRLQDVLFEGALLAAVGGDPEAAQGAIDDARLANVPQVRLDTLRGTAALFAGNNEEAIATLEKAVEQNPRSTTAWALLHWAYDYVGDLDGFARAEEMLAGMKPADDFDTVFMSLAQVRLTPHAALERIKTVVARRPTWVFAKVMLADVLAFMAVANGDAKLADAAMMNMAQARSFLSDNPFVLSVSLHAHAVATVLHGDDGDARDLRAEGDSLAQELLDRFPNYAFGRRMRAEYFTALQRLDEAEAEWNVAMRKSGDEVGSRYVAFLLRRAKYEEALAAGFFSPEVYVHMDDPQMALESAKSVSADASLLDRFWADYTRGICGEWQDAVEAWKRLQQSGEVIPHWIDRPLRLFLGESSPEEILAEAGDISQWKCHAHFMIGTHYLARGQRDSALRHFRLSVAANAFTWDVHQWALAYVARMERDPNWPSWVIEHKPALAVE